MANVKKISVSLVILLGIVVIGLWYWNAQPANVQAAIADARMAANRHDVMSVEAISEGGASVVGRHVSVVNARVNQVTGPRTFWIAGEEGDPLLCTCCGLERRQGDGSEPETGTEHTRQRCRSRTPSCRP